MYILIEEPSGSRIRLEAQACPQKGEKVLVRGRLYIVKKLSHEVQEDNNLSSRLITTVHLELYRRPD